VSLLTLKITTINSNHPFNVSFFIRQNRNRKKDYSVYCCIKIPESPPRELCIIGGIKRVEWDLRKGRPKQSSDRLIKLSLYLDSIKARLFEIYLDIRLNQGELSSENIKNTYLGKGIQDYTMLGLIDQAIQKYEKEFAKGTLKNYGATRAYVEAFCKMKYKSGDVRLKLLTYSFIDELKTYILNHPIKPNDPCTNNGCMKHLERLKKMISWAYEMRFIDRDTFSSFKIKKNPFESQRLHWEQLKTLEQKVFQRPMLNLVKDLFVFCCYTGMAPADMQHLQPHQIYAGTDGLTWLTYIRAKSKVPANVPLLSPAAALIKKYEQKRGHMIRTTVFPFVTNKDLNDNLKVISEVCEFGIPLNFYMARYTFATTVTLLNGVPITSIKEMLGHRKIESTIHYARVDKSMIGRDIMALQEKILTYY
jgi:integrase/recombinase XerD